MKLPSISQSFTVNYDYKLYFTTGLFDTSNALFVNLIRNYQTEGQVKCVFILDKGVIDANSQLSEAIDRYCSFYKSKIDLKEIITITGGEESKNNQENVTKIWNAINEKSICRHSFVVAIGGGALIDMVGYAATTAHRGVKLIRIPTTVLAQNDAAVGVKNSINAFDKKNFIGTFAIPYAIINDFDFLKTLELRDWISGIAEGLKVALIKDEPFFNFIETNAHNLANRELEAMGPLIHRCAEIHMQHIGQGGDPFENGSSRPLDFGHWAAHKLEQMTGYKLRHGEAVAKGIALDVTYAYLIGLIELATLNRILKVFREIGFDLTLPVEGEKAVNELLKGIEEFREHLGGQLTITLISGIGSKHDVHVMYRDKMVEAIAMRTIEKHESN